MTTPPGSPKMTSQPSSRRARHRMRDPFSFTPTSRPLVCCGALALAPLGEWWLPVAPDNEKLPAACSKRPGVCVCMVLWACLRSRWLLSAGSHHVATSRPWNEYQAQEADKNEADEARAD